MKPTLYTLLILFLLAACRQEEIAEEAAGYLLLENVSATASVTENIGTRAVEDDLYIGIANGTDVDLTYQPGQFPQGKLELAPGSYTLKAYNEAYLTPGSNAPRYYTEQAFAIETEKVSYVTVRVPMVNVGISLAPLSDEVSALFTDVSLAFYTTYETAATYIAPGETAYFDYAEGITFSYMLTATNADNETFTSPAKTYGGQEGQEVEPGHCYTVGYTLATPARLDSRMD